MTRSDMTCDMIARILGVKFEAVYGFAARTELLYWPTRREKDAKGKIREIDAPKKKVMKMFKVLHRYWCENFPAHPIAYGGVPRKSAFKSARRHVGKAGRVCIDISDCFNSIDTASLKSALQRNGFRSDVAWVMAQLFTVHGRVPQGSPLSTDAVNEYLRDVDAEIATNSGRMGLVATRLTDDITVSTQALDQLQESEVIIRTALSKTELQINEGKFQNNGVQTRYTPSKTHNFNTSSPRGVRLCRKHRDEGLAIANTYRTLAKEASWETVEYLAFKRQQVNGWMHFSRLADYSPAKEIRRNLEAGDRHVRNKLKEVNLDSYHKKWWQNNSKRNIASHVAALWKMRAT